MTKKTSDHGLVLAACAIFALLATVAGAAIFARMSSSAPPTSGASTPIIRGYTLTGGAVAIQADGTRLATVQVTVDSGYKLKSFTVRDATVSAGGKEQQVTPSTDSNAHPTTGVFDVTFSLPALPNGEVDPVLSFDVSWSASKGLFTKLNGSSGLLFWVRDDRLERR